MAAVGSTGAQAGHSDEAPRIAANIAKLARSKSLATRVLSRVGA
jgi:hypothetical protein